MTTLRYMPEWLVKRAAISGDQVALEFEGKQYTFARLDAQVRRFAAVLAAQGVRAGDRIALMIGNEPVFVWTLHAISRLGAVAVPLNLRLTPSELRFQLQRAEVCLLLYQRAYEPVAAQLADTGASLFCVDDVDDGIEPLPRDGGLEMDLTAVHSIMFTSGTTGRPKGAMLTFGNHWASAVGSALNLGLSADDKWLACLPLFHVGGLSILMRSLVYGMPVVLHRRFDPEKVNHALDTQGVTIISVVSAMLARMLDQRGDRPYPRSLRCVLVGGGPVPQPLLERCRRLGLPVVQTYGLTETASQVVTLSPQDAFRKLGSAGRPLFPVQIRIVKDGRTAAPCEEGEILVRAPNVMAGYYKQPDETAKAIRGGWLHTGDIGYLDDEGYLYVLDRREDMFISGGENVYPAEIEAVLAAHPAVMEAAVVGMPDPMWGQVPAAFVRLRPDAGVTADDITAHCRQHLAGYKVPKRIEFVEALPRNATGKLARRTLKERIAGA